MTDWQPIDTAPKDGSLFIARNADHPEWPCWPMLRNVRWSLGDDGFKAADLGGWLIACNIEPDYDEGHPTGGMGEIPTCIAADELNRSVRYEWMPLPEPMNKPCTKARDSDLTTDNSTFARAV